MRWRACATRAGHRRCQEIGSSPFRGRSPTLRWRRGPADRRLVTSASGNTGHRRAYGPPGETVDLLVRVLSEAVLVLVIVLENIGRSGISSLDCEYEHAHEHGDRETIDSLRGQPLHAAGVTEQPQAARPCALQPVEKLVAADQTRPQPCHVGGEGLHVDPVQTALAELLDQVQQRQP